MTIPHALFSFIALGLLLSGCGRFESKSHPTPTTAIHGLWDDRIAAGHDYTQYAVGALDSVGQNLLRMEPVDIDAFCPGYRGRDRIGRMGFWVGLLSAMALRESDFNTRSKHTEKFKDRDGNLVVSRGLLQMSFGSTSRYGCQFATAEDLHDPRQNIECGVRLLVRLVGRDGWIAGNPAEREYLGGARYWAVLRPGRSLDVITSSTRALEVCAP